MKDKDCTIKQREDYLCTKDGKYRSFIEFMRVARGLKLYKIPTFMISINGMTYREIRD